MEKINIVLAVGPSNIIIQRIEQIAAVTQLDKPNYTQNS